MINSCCLEREGINLNQICVVFSSRKMSVSFTQSLFSFLHISSSFTCLVLFAIIHALNCAVTHVLCHNKCEQLILLSGTLCVGLCYTAATYRQSLRQLFKRILQLLYFISCSQSTGNIYEYLSLRKTTQFTQYIPLYKDLTGQTYEQDEPF